LINSYVFLTPVSGLVGVTGASGSGLTSGTFSGNTDSGSSTGCPFPG